MTGLPLFPWIESPPDILPENRQPLLDLLIQIQAAARPPISQFRVAALAIGESGRAYPGVNLEFAGMPLSNSVHAEQFAVSLARHHGEPSLRHLVVTAMPCGHCRQFLLELGSHLPQITVIQPDLLWFQMTLPELLPYPFSLAASRYGLLTPSAVLLKQEQAPPRVDVLGQRAVEAASRAYVPYTKCWSGCALRLADGRVFTGNTLESAAYNPTLPALQSALIHCLAGQGEPETIEEVVFAESSPCKTSMSDSAALLLSRIAPQATFSPLRVRPEAL